MVLGGGYTSDVVLVNASDGDVRGEIILFDADGQEAWRADYTIAAGRHWLWELSEARPVARTYYAVVSGNVAAAAMVRRSDDGLITATSRAPASLVKLARVPVDTMADLVRHGRSSELALVIANPDTSGASVRFFLRDLDGREVDRVEQLMMPKTQVLFTLGSLFDRTSFAGTVAIASDVAVAVSARQITTNLRGDEILTELPVLDADSSRSELVLPYVDGKGEATQWFVVGRNTTAEVSVELKRLDGTPMTAILR